MSKSYHVCQSISGLENLIKQGKKIDWLLIYGRPATISEIKEAIKEAKAKGYVVIPPCDNLTSKGYCAGHNIDD